MELDLNPSRAGKRLTERDPTKPLLKESKGSEKDVQLKGLGSIRQKAKPWLVVSGVPGHFRKNCWIPSFFSSDGTGQEAMNCFFQARAFRRRKKRKKGLCPAQKD